MRPGLSDNSTKSDPKVSVIVTAQKRRQFVLEAVRSVLEQKKLQNPVEILVIKDFSDLDIDKFLHDNGIQTILCSGSLGEMLYQGVSQSKGDIICFLDDDDTFNECKIESIVGLFLNLPEVALISHKQTAMITNVSNPRPNESDHLEYKQIRTSSSSPREIIKLINEGIDFNLSSMCIRSDLVSRNLEKLMTIEGGPDTFFFLLALSSSTDILRLSNRLTNYRIRTTPDGTVSFGATDISIWSRRSQFMIDTISQFRNTGNSVCNIVADYLVSDWTITQGLMRSIRKRLFYMKALKKHLSFFRIFSSSYYFVKVFLTISCAISPRAGQFLYKILKNENVQKLLD